jgi:hypothetical protein
MVVNRQIYLDAAKFNKYTIHVSVGVSLMIVGLLLLFAHRQRAGFILTISLLLGLAIQTHYLNGLRYQEDWQYQKELWWQFTWRAPDVRDDTLLAVKIPTEISISEDYEIWAPANIIYRPESPVVKITAEIISPETEGRFLRGIQNKEVFRGEIKLSKNFGNVLILTIPHPLSCLHVLDGNRLEDYREEPQVRTIHETSHIDRIIIEADRTTSPPVEIFGPKPERKWCYYYQKISLANQRENWKEAASLADKALELGYEPYNKSEWIPTFEAYVNLNRIEDARKIATKIRKDKDLKYLYCNQIQNHDNEMAYALICENK